MIYQRVYSLANVFVSSYIYGMGRSRNWNRLVDQMGLGLNKFQGDEGGSETKPVLHRDTKKHPYGNPKWRNFRSSLGLKGMNKKQRERYIEDKDDIAEWNNRPIPELTRAERNHQRDLDTEEWLHRKALERILPMGMYVDDYVNDLKLRQEPSYIEELDKLYRAEYPAHYERLDAEKAAKAEAEKNQKRYGGDLPKAQVGIPPPGETIIPHESTVGQVQPDFYVDSNSSYEVNSSTNKRGKNKVKNNFLEDTTVTDSDGYSTMNTRSVDNGNKKYKQVFNVYDTENNLLAKSVDKINIFGNPKNRTRVTAKGKEAGYDAKYGGALPEAQFGKGLKKLQQKIRDNRVANTPIRDAGGLDAINMLDNWQPGDETNMGHYDPRTNEIVMWRENAGDNYDDALEHEQIHASQYGPFSRMWYKMNDNGMDPSYKGARIQDKPMRKAYRKLTKGKNQVQDLLLPDNERTFNAAGQYVLNKGEEFEAVLSTGINAAQKHGINFDGSFDNILSQLNTIPEEERSNNLRGLTKFMSNAFTEEQKEIIFKSLIQQGR